MHVCDRNTEKRINENVLTGCSEGFEYKTSQQDE